jgi:NAD(P)H-nitrite reductase large subunit
MVQFPTRRIPNFAPFQDGLRCLSSTLNISVKDMFRRLHDCQGRVAARARVTDYDCIVIREVVSGLCTLRYLYTHHKDLMIATEVSLHPGDPVWRVTFDASQTVANRIP